MVRFEDGPEFARADIHVPETQNTNLSFPKFLFTRLAGNLQPFLHWSTFEATHRRIGYAFSTPEEQSGGCCKACSGNPCRVEISALALATERLSSGLQISYRSNGWTGTKPDE